MTTKNGHVKNWISMIKKKLRILVIRISVAAAALLSAASSDILYRRFEADSVVTAVRQEGIYRFVVVVSSKASVCTGTILNKDWVLTAAHCFYYKKNKINDNAAVIIAGVINYDFPKGNTKQETASLEIVVHPGFWHGRLAKFDIALVRVEPSFEFNDYVSSINVAGDEWPQTDNLSDNCKSLGFGETRDTEVEKGDLKVWNITTAQHGAHACPCAKRYEYKRLVCVREYLNPLLCSGDDGGPLVCGNVVRAIAHMTQRHICDNPQYPKKRCAYGPEKGLSTYMFLCPFNDWIHTYVPEVPSTPVSCKAPLVSHSLATLAILSFRGLPRLWGYVNL